MQFPLPDAEKEYLKSFTGVFHSSAEADDYLYNAWTRMQTVLEWLSRLDSQGVKRVLELGSNPYLLTLLMKRHFHFDLELANFFGDPAANGTHVQVAEGSGERHEFRFEHFNLEIDRFPYPDGSLDCVLFCEIVEHLLLNPDHAMSEISRVLRPDGYVIVTTPNVARLGNAIRLLRGYNIYDDYSPHGIYGRHNREYTMQEVVDLAERHSFHIVERRLKNVYPHALKARVLQALRPNTWYEHIFVLGQK